jgi:hypothetical protein
VGRVGKHGASFHRHTGQTLVDQAPRDHFMGIFEGRIGITDFPAQV